MKQKKIPLSLQIFLALGLGIAVGMAFTGNPTFAVSYIKPFGTIFLNLLKFVVVPIVFFSILSGIISMSDIRKVGSIGVKTLVYYTCTTAGAIVLAMFLANLFKGFFTVIDPTGVTFEPGETASFMDTLVDIFPSNIIAPFANASMLQVIVAALLLLRMTERSRMGADAAIAVTSASALAVGVIVTSLTTGMTTDVDSYMFGSILAMDRADVALSVGLSIAVLALFVLFYHRLFAITFDESFSRATGVKVGLYNTLLSVLTALTIVLGMRMMGAMLISSLVIFPALSAMRVLKSFRGVVICSGCISVASFCVGLTSSYLLGTPVGASVVLVDLAVFLVCCGIARVKKAN